MPVGSGAFSRRFRSGAQSDSHRSVSTPCPPNRTCGFPASGSPVGSCLSHTETPVRSRFQPSPVTRGTSGFACPRLPEAARLHPRCPSPTRHQTCARPDSTEPPIGQPGPFAYACDASEFSAPSRGVRRQSHSRGPSPLRHPSTPEAPFLDGHYPGLQSYWPLRHPAGPACPSRGPGCHVHGTDRASRVATLSIFHACRRHYPGGNRPVHSSFSSQPVGGLPLFPGGSTSALTVSRPARRSLAFRPAWSLSRPRRPFYQSASAHIVTSMNRSGRYQPERQLLGGVRTHQESAPFHGALKTWLYPTVKPSRAEPSRAEPSRAEPSRAEPSRAEPSRAEPSRAEPSRAEPRPTWQDRRRGHERSQSRGPALRRSCGSRIVVCLRGRDHGTPTATASRTRPSHHGHGQPGNRRADRPGSDRATLGGSA